MSSSPSINKQQPRPSPRHRRAIQSDFRRGRRELDLVEQRDDLVEGCRSGSSVVPHVVVLKHAREDPPRDDEHQNHVHYLECDNVGERNRHNVLPV